MDWSKSGTGSDSAGWKVGVPCEEIALGRSSSGREGRGFVVQEDGRDDRRIGQKREDPHLGAAGGTQERQ